jgi:hypothetical protein
MVDSVAEGWTNESVLQSLFVRLITTSECLRVQWASFAPPPAGLLMSHNMTSEIGSRDELMNDILQDLWR